MGDFVERVIKKFAGVPVPEGDLRFQYGRDIYDILGVDEDGVDYRDSSGYSSKLILPSALVLGRVEVSLGVVGTRVVFHLKEHR